MGFWTDDESRREAFERGRRDGRASDFLDEVFDGLGDVAASPVPGTEEYEAYRAGREEGLEARYAGMEEDEDEDDDGEVEGEPVYRVRGTKKQWLARFPGMAKYFENHGKSDPNHVYVLRMTKSQWDTVRKVRRPAPASREPASDSSAAQENAKETGFTLGKLLGLGALVLLGAAILGASGDKSKDDK